MTIEKISNIQIALTDEVIERKWNDVIVKRNKLLSISDWTQLHDAVITKEMRNAWIKWRQKVRQVKKSTVIDFDKAMELLNVLELQMPVKIHYIPTENIISENSITNPPDNILSEDFDKKLNELRDNLTGSIVSMRDIDSFISEKLNDNNDKLIEILKHLINEKMITHPAIPPSIKPFEILKNELLSDISKKYHTIFSEYTEVDNEKFKQAVDYIVDKTPNIDHYPLLKLAFKYDTRNTEEIIKDIINCRNKWLQNICRHEENRVNYTNRVINSTSEEELNIIRIELDI